jgi:GMP reductase
MENKMHIEENVKLDFKDVLIRPKRSTLNSRSEVDIHREFKLLHSAHKYSGIPIVAANMDTVGTFSMANLLMLYLLFFSIIKSALKTTSSVARPIVSVVKYFA